VCVVGGGFEEGLKEDDPAEDDDLEVELAAVDDVSSALRFATGFEALEFESIPVPTTLTKRLFGHGVLVPVVGSGGWLIQGQQIGSPF
jgi:hypothetical protein